MSPDDYNPDEDIFFLDTTIAGEQVRDLSALVLTGNGSDAQLALAKLCVRTSPMYMREIAQRVIGITGSYAAFSTSGNIMAKHVMSNLQGFVVAANAIAHRYGIVDTPGGGD